MEEFFQNAKVEHGWQWSPFSCALSQRSGPLLNDRYHEAFCFGIGYVVCEIGEYISEAFFEHLGNGDDRLFRETCSNSKVVHPFSPHLLGTG